MVQLLQSAKTPSVITATVTIGIFLNPSATEIHIEGDREITEITILNLTGSVVLKKSLNKKLSYTILHELRDGAYIINCRDQDLFLQPGRLLFLMVSYIKKMKLQHS